MGWHSKQPCSQRCTWATPLLHVPWPTLSGYRPSVLPWNSDWWCKFREENNPHHQPWEFNSWDINLGVITDVSAKGWIGVFKPTHACPSQETSTSGPVSLKQQFYWLLSGLCLFQETRIKSLQFSLQLLPHSTASSRSVQTADLGILDESKDTKSK